MMWIAVVLLGIAALGGLAFSCVISTPRRPASDATYVSHAYVAAAATTGAAVLGAAAAILVASA